MKKQNIEVEGEEILLMSKEGHYAVIPAKHRQEVMDMVKDGCDDCINNYIQTLPKERDYAEDGSLYPEEPIINPDNSIQLEEVTLTAEAPTYIKYRQKWAKENPFDLNKYVDDRFNNPVGREAIERIDEEGWRKQLKQEGLRKRQQELDEATKMGLLYQRFNPQNKDDISIADEQFKKRYGTSPHRYRYDNDPEYRKYYKQIAKEATSKIEYPSTDLRRKDVVAPNNMWMYPNLTGAIKAQATNFSNEVIGIALPIPGLEAMGKIPSVFKAGKNLIKPASKVLNKTDDVVKAGSKVLNKTDDVKVFNSILDNPKEIEAITNNIKDISKDDIIKLEGYLKDTYDYENLTPWQKIKLLDRESYYLKKNNISVSDRIENDKKLLKFWEDYKKERKTYFESPKFRERLEKQVGKMGDEEFAQYKLDLLSNLERRPYIRPDVVADYSSAHYKPKSHFGDPNHTPGHTYYTDKTVTKRTVEHEGRHQLTNADDAIYGFPSQQELEANLIHPDLLSLDPDFTRNVGNKTGREYFLSPEEFIVRLDELKRDLSKVGYDYMTEDLTPEILKKYKGLTPKEAIHKVTGKSYGVKLEELSPEQHRQVLQLLDNNPEQTRDASRLLRWFKEDFLINQINNKWGIIPLAIGIGTAVKLQNQNKTE
jgi:hypothetical protein